MKRKSHPIDAKHCQSRANGPSSGPCQELRGYPAVLYRQSAMLGEAAVALHGYYRDEVNRLLRPVAKESYNTREGRSNYYRQQQ